MQPTDVIQFWFQELAPAQWWSKDEAFDRRIGEKFSPTIEEAARCELWAWRESPQGRLAEIIVLDQFSRNVHRDSARAFENDRLALALAQEAVSVGADQRLEAVQKNFLYMPYMHSESLRVHREAQRLFAGCDARTRDFARQHAAIIERFGRYPHRNSIVGRESTEEELEFLQQPGSSF